jgi:hypothetical protein
VRSRFKEDGLVNTEILPVLSTALNKVNRVASPADGPGEGEEGGLDAWTGRFCG